MPRSAPERGTKGHSLSQDRLGRIGFLFPERQTGRGAAQQGGRGWGSSPSQAQGCGSEGQNPRAPAGLGAAQAQRGAAPWPCEGMGPGLSSEPSLSRFLHLSGSSKRGKKLIDGRATARCARQGWVGTPTSPLGWEARVGADSAVPRAVGAVRVKLWFQSRVSEVWGSAAHARLVAIPAPSSGSWARRGGHGWQREVSRSKKQRVLPSR